MYGGKEKKNLRKISYKIFQPTVIRVDCCGRKGGGSQGNPGTEFLSHSGQDLTYLAQGELSARVTSEHSQKILEPEENHVQSSGSQPDWHRMTPLQESSLHSAVNPVEIHV